MPLKLQTPNRDSMCVVVNPFPIMVVATGPGPPEQKLIFKPFEFDDDDYKCMRLITDHTAGMMVKRQPKLVKLSEAKGWEFSDTVDKLRDEHPNWSDREVFESAWLQVLKHPVPQARNQDTDKILEERCNRRLDEMMIPATVYANPQKPWPTWWKLQVIEDKSLAWEDFEEFAEGEKATIQPEERSVRAREARAREAARQSSTEAERLRKEQIRIKARNAQASARRLTEAKQEREAPVVLADVDKVLEAARD